MSQQEFTVIDEDKSYHFAISPQKGIDGLGKLYLIQTKAWEPADGSTPWRLALHPWSSGLGPNRINPSITLAGDLRNRPGMTYAKGNLDASYEGFATFPPDFTLLDALITASTSISTVNQLKYNVAQYGNVSYMGAASALTAADVSVRNFNNKAYFGAGQRLFSIDQNLTLAIVKDFGAGKNVYDIEPFNDQLVIAMGETEKIWTMTTVEGFTQATDSTYAIALGRTNELLWRAESVNKISNCITAPRTLTSWTPSSPNQYSAGDSTYSISDLVEYGGIIAAIRPDGVFFPDTETNFHNQTPQLSVYPHHDNGHGAFTAWGSLFVPSIIGLLQVDVGSSIVVGPELSQRPDFRFHVHAGVEWNGAIYLICADHAESEETFICKMTRTGASSNPYVYHEWMRMGTTDEGNTVIVYTGSSNPTLIAGRGIGFSLTTLGRGSGPDIDDSRYTYGTEFVLEPGLVIASSDLGIEIDLTGIKVVAKQVSGGTITVQHDMDKSGTWTNLYSTVDGAGIAPISKSGWIAETRYALPNTTGHGLYLRVLATMPAGQQGTDRTEIYEIWAFGNSHPDTTDIITLDIYSDIKARVRGLIQGRGIGGTQRLFRSWAQSGKTIEIKLPGYDPDQRIRAQILEVITNNASMLQSGDSHLPSNTIRLILRRIDYSGDLNGDE